MDAGAVIIRSRRRTQRRGALMQGGRRFAFSKASGGMGSTGAPGWVAQYDLPSGQSSFVLDFVNGQYWDGQALVALAAVVGGTPSVNGSGLLLDSTSLTGIGAVLTTAKVAARTIVAEVSGGSGTGGIVSFDLDAPIFEVSVAGADRCYINATNLDTANVAAWGGVNFAAAALNGAGSAAVLNQGVVVTNAQVAAAPVGVQLGSYSGGSIFGGRMRRLIGYTRRLTAAEMSSVCWPAPFLFPFAGASSIKFNASQQLSAGNVLQYEKTQAWTMIAAINVRAKPAVAGVIFSNVTGAAPVAGYEAYIDSNGFLHVRLISTFSTNDYLGVAGSVDLTDGRWHVVAVSYDGSATAAGVKLYVDGVPDTGATVERDTLAGLIASAGAFFIGNQKDFEATLYLAGGLDEFSLSNVVRNAAYIAAHATASTMPTVDASTVLSYALNEAAGTSVTDGSASGFTGTLTSAAQWLL